MPIYGASFQQGQCRVARFLLNGFHECDSAHAGKGFLRQHFWEANGWATRSRADTLLLFCRPEQNDSPSCAE
jgi:hypothetical protein